MSDVEKGVKKVGRKIDPTQNPLIKKSLAPFKIGSIDPASGARKVARRAEAQQLTSIGSQQQKEELRLAEAGDVIARKKLLAKTGGRRSLISTR